MSCPACFQGGVSTSHPTGKETTVHGLATYVAEPEENATPKGIIVFITDAFGWDFVNNRVLCDHYAKGGFLVYCPDFMNGSSMPSRALTLMDEIMKPGSWFNAFVRKPLYVLQLLAMGLPWKYRTRYSVSQPRVFSFVKALRTSPPPFDTNNLKIGAAGFCWGGRHTVLLAADTPSSRVYRHESQVNSSSLEPLIDCAFTAHPSYIEVPRDIEAITIPTSVAVGENDMAMGANNIQQMKGILENKKVGEHEVVIIPGAKHGFSLRTHADDKHEMECAQQAEDQAISWFARWFN